MAAASTTFLNAAESRASAVERLLTPSSYGFFLTIPEITLRVKEGLPLTVLDPHKAGIASEAAPTKPASSLDAGKKTKIVDRAVSYVQQEEKFEATFPDGMKRDPRLFKLSQSGRDEWMGLIDFFIEEFKKQRLNKAKQTQIKSFLKQIIFGLFAFEQCLKIRKYDTLLVEDLASKMRSYDVLFAADLNRGNGIVIDTGIEALSFLDEESVEFKNLLTIILNTEKTVSLLNSMPDLGLSDHKVINHLVKGFLESINFSEASDSIKSYIDLMSYLVIRETIQFRWIEIVNFLTEESGKFSATGVFRIFINSFPSDRIRLVHDMLRQTQDMPDLFHYFLHDPKDTVDSLVVFDEEGETDRRPCQFLKDFYKKIYTFLDEQDSKYLEIEYKGFTGKLSSELEEPLENVSSKQQLGRGAAIEKVSMPEEPLVKISSSKKKKKNSSKKSELLLTGIQKLDSQEGEQSTDAVSQKVSPDEKEDKSDEDEGPEKSVSDKKKKRKKKKKHALASMVSVSEENYFADYLQNDITISYTKSARAWLKSPQEIFERDGYLEDNPPRGSIRETRRNVFLNYKHLYNGDEKQAQQAVIDSHSLPELLDKILLQMPAQELADDAFRVESPLLKKNRDGSFDFGVYELFFYKTGPTRFKLYHKVFKPFERHRILGNIPAEFVDVIAHEKRRGALPLDEERQDFDESGAESDWVPAAGQWIQELLPTMNGLKFINSKDGVQYTLME